MKQNTSFTALLSIAVAFVTWLDAAGASSLRRGSSHASLDPVDVELSNLAADQSISDKAWTDASSVPYLMLHGHNRKFFFCMIPKNACSEFLSLAMRMDGMDDRHWNLVANGMSQGDVHFDGQREYMFVKNQAEFKDIFTRKTKKTVFLRDPVTRLLSAYRSKVMEGYYERSKGWPRTIEFEDFVRALAQDMSVDPYQDPHLRPQSYLCGLNETIEHYDFVGNFDNLDEDAHGMVATIGGNGFAKHMLESGWGFDGHQSLFGVPREARDGALAMSSTNSNDAHVLVGKSSTVSLNLKYQWHEFISEESFIQSKLEWLKHNPALEKIIKDMYRIDYELLARAKVHMASLQ